MLIYNFTVTLVLMFLVSCTQLSHRSYLSEMEEEDGDLFIPKEDFPVVAGDTGRDWYTERERKRRTPASQEERAQDYATTSLRSELYHLETSQSEYELTLYDEHKDRFRTMSEKIYFLKLPYHERKEYLINRGFIEGMRSTTSSEVRSYGNEIQSSDVSLGMSKDHVMSQMGKPLRIEVAGNPRNENERWLYRMNGASRYIYFEAGQVQGWE